MTKAATISNLTRRHLVGCFGSAAWNGDSAEADEVGFLSRLYDLAALPSTDSRFADAAGDIMCHRVSFGDWEDDWIFADARFELQHDDQKLLRFLAEALHPEVRAASAVAPMLAQLNACLIRDGWELYEESKLSGYPVFGWRRCAAPGDFPPALDVVVAGRYYLRDLVGSGGFGCVMRARDLRGGADVAVKFFDSADEDIKRFSREIDAMTAIAHPHVIRVLDADLSNSPPFLVMPLAECTLDAWAKKHRSDKAGLIERFLQVCDGLHAAHQAGLMHRDIKPLNMLVFGESTVIADFGLARDVSRDVSKLTKTTSIIGTEEYLAPEQRVRGGSRSADARTDVYMLGRSLYELLTGNSPSLIDEDLLDPGIRSVILKATSENPSRRYASVAEFGDAVRAYQLSLDPAAKADVIFRSALAESSELLQKKQYRADNIRQLMVVWLTVKDAKLAQELWDELPTELMAPMVLVDAVLLEQCLRRLKRVYDETLDGRAWAYAETVALRMQAIVMAGTSAALWAEGLRLALVAAVKMNRFAAMDTFNALLTSMPDDSVSAAVADMLREERTAYQSVAAQLQPSQLPLAVRAIRDAVLQK